MRRKFAIILKPPKGDGNEHNKTSAAFAQIFQLLDGADIVRRRTP